MRHVLLYRHDAFTSGGEMDDTKKINKTFVVDEPTLAHIQAVAIKLRASDSYALRMIVAEHLAYEEIARAKNIVLEPQ